MGEALYSHQRWVVNQKVKKSLELTEVKCYPNTKEALSKLGILQIMKLEKTGNRLTRG